MSETPRTAVVLARISDARNGDEAGVTGQVADARALAARLGWGIGPEQTHMIVENDTSAYQRKRIRLADGRSELRTVRPGFRRALDMLASGEADGLLALDLDRAARDPRDLEDLIDVVESRRPHIPVESVTGSLRLASDADVAMARVMVAMGNKSSRDTGRRVAARRRQKAEAGEYAGGRRPYGYARDGLTVVEAEAAEVRRMADQILVGVSLRAVTAGLRERGVPTVKGGPWEAPTVRDILTKARNAGLAQYRGEVTGPAAWPAILPEATWRAVTALLSDPARRTSPGNTPRWLGSLIYVCGMCGGTVAVSGGSADRSPSYVCRAHNHLRRAARPVDAYVSDLIVRRLARPDAATLIARPDCPDTAEAEAELIAQRERGRQLAEAFADGGITAQQLRAGSARINARIAALTAALARGAERSPLEPVAGRPDAARVWAGLDLGRQRAILRILLDVTLLKGHPGRRASGASFDAAPVSVKWRDVR